MEPSGPAQPADQLEQEHCGRSTDAAVVVHDAAHERELWMEGNEQPGRDASHSCPGASSRTVRKANAAARAASSAETKRAAVSCETVLWPETAALAGTVSS
jgi:hypothetical protein